MYLANEKNKNFRNTQNRTNHENKQRMNEWNFNSEKFWTALCLRLCETATPTQQYYHRREFPERRREESLRDRLFALLAFFANLPNIFGLFWTARKTIKALTGSGKNFVIKLLKYFQHKLVAEKFSSLVCLVLRCASEINLKALFHTWLILLYFHLEREREKKSAENMKCSEIILIMQKLLSESESNIKLNLEQKISAICDP